MKVVKYPLPVNEIIDRFQEVLKDKDLVFRTSDLYKAGIENQDVLNEALLKTIHILRLANLNTSHYIKRIYVTDIENGNTYLDWRMNKMTFFFVILNAESQNPVIVKWKSKILDLLKLDID